MNDLAKLTEFATRYANAWCSQNPESVAAFFAENGSISINNGPPAVGRAAIAQQAQAFMTTFPDMVVTTDKVAHDQEGTKFHWTLTGTNTGPGGTGKRVRISGYELWKIDNDVLIGESKGHFDGAEYERQLEHGVDGQPSVLTMNLNDLANLGQIIGAAAVVVSLIYVALQIRQNTNAVRSAAAQVVHEHFASWYHLLASDESLSQVAIDGLKDYGSLSGKDKARFVAAFMAFLAYSQNAFLKWREKMLQPQLWMDWELLIMNLVSSPGGKEFWKERGYLFGEEFRRHVEDDLMKRTPHPDAKPLGAFPIGQPAKQVRAGPAVNMDAFFASLPAEKRMEQRGQVRHGRQSREIVVERAGRQPRYNQGEESTRFNALTIQQFNGFS